MSFLIDAKVEIVLDLHGSHEIVHSRQIYELTNLMATEYDKMRANYWRFFYKKFCYDKIMSNCDCVAATNNLWKYTIGKRVAKNDRDGRRLIDEFSENLSFRGEKDEVSENVKKNHTQAMRIGSNLLCELMNKYNLRDA